MAARIGYDRFGRSDQPMVFGHEFSGAVAEYGPGCRGDVATGAPVVALPLVRGPRGIDAVGLSPHAPGAYAEQLVVQESMMLPVPNGLGPTSPRSPSRWPSPGTPCSGARSASARWRS